MFINSLAEIIREQVFCSFGKPEKKRITVLFRNSMFIIFAVVLYVLVTLRYKRRGNQVIKFKIHTWRF